MALSRVNLSDPVTLRGYAHPLRMTLIGLLRRQGPMTATRAAELLGESVPSCSFHLRQLAKYGLAERVPGADGRERPWRATAAVTTWDEGAEDPEMRAATDQLSAVQLARYVRRAEDFVARRAQEPASWRAVTGFSDALLHVTPAELAELTRRMDALFAEYDDRVTDPAARPAGTRPVALFQMLMPIEDGPPPAAPPAAGLDRPGEDGPSPDDRAQADD
ncbi:winged helix-turn-helix domain-containing protein [Micromonospora inositola]|uniref:Transcriptional regulator, ArsR family n=1 Tax=Micromonospora inositola TaxID=47865 RepID=A0A1C5HJ26_9ACTN|nr:helix-turn-helix domain-containing protein [Micromonospora inositola]SCG46026.1 transcriptional regulator, ArsR family [Micromonospora inositola]